MSLLVSHSSYPTTILTHGVQNLILSSSHLAVTAFYTPEVTFVISLPFFSRVTIHCHMKLKLHTPRSCSDGGETTGGRQALSKVSWICPSLSQLGVSFNDALFI